MAGTASRGEAAAVAAREPGLAWIAGSVHGNEPSGADADMRLLYELAAGRDCATERRVARLVTFLLPVQNPDGRAAARRTNAAGFDLNRDWFARTQPETAGKLDALRRYPPLVFVDQHEESGTGFFVPPNADPVHHEISAHALHAIDDVLGPAVRRALTARGVDVTSDATYDLFFMGYGDTAPTTLFGAAGMTFEKGNGSPYAERVAEHLLAARTVLSTAARDKDALLRGWAAQWRAARAQGARGTLQPNRVLQRGHRVSHPVPRARVFGYALRADVHGADAARLAGRLADAGVVVRRLAAPARARLRAFGARAAAVTTLPAGTFVVPAEQGAKHWVQALLADDAYVPFPYVYDVTAWSNPLLMGLAGGALAARLPRSARLVPDAPPPAPPAGAAAYAFAGDAEGAAELAVALLRAGVPVRRVPGSGAYVAGAAPTSDELARTRVSVAEAADATAGTALRLPRLGVVAEDPGVPSLSAAWARYAVERRLGLPLASVDGTAVAAGRLSSLDALLVPDGVAALPGPALAALGLWVRAGGTLIGWRGEGLAAARGAGVTAVTSAAAAPGVLVPGAALRTELDATDPVAWGEERTGFAFVVGDPVMAANGARSSPATRRAPASGCRASRRAPTPCAERPPRPTSAWARAASPSSRSTPPSAATPRGRCGCSPTRSSRRRPELARRGRARAGRCDAISPARPGRAGARRSGASRRSRPRRARAPGRGRCRR